MKNILFLVESYWGSGHMNVAAESAQALTKNGHRVAIASSGSSFEAGKDFDYGRARKLPLPGLARDSRGRALITANGKSIDQDFSAGAGRNDIILRELGSEKYDAVMVEAWPFGLHMFDNQFIPLMNTLCDQGLPIYGVARDVLGYPESRKDDPAYHDMRAVELANQYFDRLYVLSDPAICRLEDSLTPGAFASLVTPVDHIGFMGAAVMPARQDMPDAQRPIVIAGGGSFKGVVRQHMLDVVTAVVQAKTFSSLAQNPVLVIVGKDAAPEEITLLQAMGPDIQAVPFMPSTEFRQHVANAALVINKGGRNIAVDCIQAVKGGPVAQIITPMTDENGPWREAVIRAAAFEKHNLSVTLNGVDLVIPEFCVNAIERARAMAAVQYNKQIDINLDGATTLVKAISSESASHIPLLFPDYSI